MSCDDLAGFAETLTAFANTQIDSEPPKALMVLGPIDGEGPTLTVPLSAKAMANLGAAVVDASGRTHCRGCGRPSPVYVLNPGDNWTCDACPAAA